MKKYFEVIKKSPLFAGINDEDIASLLACLNTKEISYSEGEFVFAAGDKPERIGLVLSGSVRIVQEDYWGNRTIITSIETGGLFAEALTCAGAEVFPFFVLAHGDTQLMMLDYKRIISTCTSSCVFHARLIRNMLTILANKNITLTRKMEHITKKTTREKVLSYLSEQALLSNSEVFSIPFNRQELADYLSVERSALSATLSKMKEEGLLDYNKNHFKLMKGWL